MMETDFCPAYHFSSSFDALNTMRGDNQLCDIQFIIGDKRVIAHKNILASYSVYFHNMFHGNLRDSQVLEINNVEITPNSFELLVDFMYTSHLIINDSNVQELLRASVFLLLENVKEECQKFLRRIVCVDNFIAITDVAVKYKLNDLYDSCLSYALKNYNDIVKSHVYLSLPYELLIKLIQSDDLCAVEEMVFKSAMLWMKHDIVGRSKHLLDVLKAIRLCIMSIDNLHDYVLKEDLVKSNTECLKYIFVILVEKGNGVHESSSTFNFKPRKCFQDLELQKITRDRDLEYDKIRKSLKPKEVFHQSENNMVSSYKAINVMRKEGIFCDLSIKTESKIITVHKIILATNSEYFNKMLTEGFNETEKNEITLNEIKPDILELLIDYMYTSNLKITANNVLDILLSSDLLLLEDIHRRCIEFLKENINIENCLKLKHFVDIADSHDFLSLSVDEIAELIQNDKLNAEEVKIFESVMCWIRYDLDNHSQYLLKLMKCIRMSMIPFSYFNENIDNDEMIKNNCQALLYETYKEYAKKFERNDIEIFSNYTNRQQHYKNYKLILAMRFVFDIELQFIWFAAGSEIYSTKTLMLNAPIDGKSQCLILSDGRIFCVRCSKCDHGPSSMFDGNTKIWYNLCEFELCKDFCTPDLSLVELDGCIYVMSLHGDFNCYNIKNKNWSRFEVVCDNDDDDNDDNNIFNDIYFLKLIISDGFIYLVNENGVFQFCKNTNLGQSMSRENILFNRSCYSSCSLNFFLYIFGGKDDKKTPLKSAMKFNLSTKTWNNIADMNHARYNAVVTVADGLIYVIGSDHFDNKIDSVEIYDPQLDKWTLSKIKLPRVHHWSNAIVLNPTENINLDNISNYYSFNV